MNMQAMLQQAQRIQRDITKKKEELERETFTGKSEWVEVTFNGKKMIQSVKITKDDFASDDKEMLEDMLMLAVKDAIKKVDVATDEKLDKYSALNGLI